MDHLVFLSLKRNENSLYRTTKWLWIKEAENNEREREMAGIANGVGLLISFMLICGGNLHYNMI